MVDCLQLMGCKPGTVAEVGRKINTAEKQFASFKFFSLLLLFWEQFIRGAGNQPKRGFIVWTGLGNEDWWSEI